MIARNILALVVILGLALLLQFTVLSRINLLSGNADLILIILAAWALQERARYTWIFGATAGLLVGAISSAPAIIYLASYLSVIGLARLLTRRIWQAPLLAMFTVTFSGMLLLTLLTYLYRVLFDNVTLLFGEVFIQVILPSLLMTLLLSLLVYPFMRDIAGRLYPEEAGS